MASFEQRVESVEEAVSTLSDRVDLESGLAASRDRDTADVLAKLAGQQRVMNALRETQLEHGVRLDGIDGRLDVIDGRLDVIDGRLDVIDGRLDVIEGRLGEQGAGVQTIIGMLTVLIERDSAVES